MANIGKSITIKGDLSGNEDLQIDGTVEGRIDLPNNQLTIGAEGRVKAEVHAKAVIVVGHVTGQSVGGRSHPGRGHRDRGRRCESPAPGHPGGRDAQRRRRDEQRRQVQPRGGASDARQGGRRRSVGRARGTRPPLQAFAARALLAARAATPVRQRSSQSSVGEAM